MTTSLQKMLHDFGGYEQLKQPIITKKEYLAVRDVLIKEIDELFHSSEVPMMDKQVSEDAGVDKVKVLYMIENGWFGKIKVTKDSGHKFFFLIDGITLNWTNYFRLRD